MAHIHNPSAWEAEVGRSQCQGHERHSNTLSPKKGKRELKDCVDDIVRPCLKQNETDSLGLVRVHGGFFQSGDSFIV